MLADRGWIGRQAFFWMMTPRSAPSLHWALPTNFFDLTIRDSCWICSTRFNDITRDLAVVVVECVLGSTVKTVETFEPKRRRMPQIEIKKRCRGCWPKKHGSPNQGFCSLVCDKSDRRINRSSIPIQSSHSSENSLGINIEHSPSVIPKYADIWLHILHCTTSCRWWMKSVPLWFEANSVRTMCFGRCDSP